MHYGVRMARSPARSCRLLPACLVTRPAVHGSRRFGERSRTQLSLAALPQRARCPCSALVDQGRGLGRGTRSHRTYCIVAPHSNYALLDGRGTISPARTGSHLAAVAELAWLSAIRLDGLMQRLKASCLTTLRKTFDSRFEGDGAVEDLMWFPASALIDKPRVADMLRQTQQSTQSSPERAMRLLLELLNLDRHGRHHELVERRARNYAVCRRRCLRPT